MIAKISRGSSFYGAANYNQQKVDKGEAKVLAYKGLLNTKPSTIDHTLNSLNNSRTKKPVFHASLSFSYKDHPKLNDNKLVAITNDYLKQMGYDKQPHVIYRHHDTNHPHVHILTTRVDTQKGQRLPSYNEGIKSKAITEQLELKYQLTIAQEQRNHLKTVIVSDVKQVLQNDKPESVIAMNNALSEKGSNYRIKAVRSGGVYYNVNDNDKRKPVRFKSSLADFKRAGVSFSHLEKAFKNNRMERLKVKELVNNALPQNGKMSLSKFFKALQEKGVTTIVYKNDKIVSGIGYNYKGHTYRGHELNPKLSFDNVNKQLQLSIAREHQLQLSIGR